VARDRNSYPAGIRCHIHLISLKCADCRLWRIIFILAKAQSPGRDLYFNANFSASDGKSTILRVILFACIRRMYYVVLGGDKFTETEDYWQ